MLYQGKAFDVEPEFYCDALDCFSVLCLIAAFMVMGFFL